ncbi:PVC-type heme-binding CxxCH protein [Planctomycetaceae bacterium SH139]
MKYLLIPSFLAFLFGFTAQLEHRCWAADRLDGEHVVGAAEPNSPSDWYGAGVRPSGPRTPEEQRAGFHLPPGFQVELVAAEPIIAKPMNLAWDSSGRLWVTDSFEYPYPAGDEQPKRDSVRILRDTDGDRVPDTAVVFATGLNIPIGVLPYGDGCLCFSIPNIYYLRDTDGDGVCDRREVVLGPFDTTRDTHGMINSMRMGADGWVYANHGFNNQSTVAGKDGHSITMHSGNSFRFRPDGSRVEQVTWGQVNPFGRAMDAWGYYFTADCHSKPLSQLIRGGYYPSFGRPDDGLGFVPPMMDHLHGSTAISGVEFLSAELGIDELADQTLSGNVMTSRLNRNRIEYTGASARAIPLPDFMTSDDPWFRPVDVRLGPDGAIYVADFYNKIIGHYEVPLDHPGRDRFRGRIWRISRVSNGAHEEDGLQESLAVSEGPLVDAWGSCNLVRRDLALAHSLRHPDANLDADAKELLRATSADSAVEESEIANQEVRAGQMRVRQRIVALWYLLRRGQLTEQLLREAELSNSQSAQLRLHGLRAMVELVVGRQQAAFKVMARDTAVAALNDVNPHVRRQAAELLGMVPANQFVPHLLDAWSQAAEDDTILRQTIRIAIRNQVRDFPSEDLAKVLDQAMLGPLSEQLATVLVAVDSVVAGKTLLTFLGDGDARPSQSVEFLAHAARCLKAQPEANDVVMVARELTNRLPAQRQEIMNVIAIELGDAEAAQASMRAWAAERVSLELAALEELAKAGRTLDVAWESETGTGWPTQQRRTSSGEEIQVTSSFPLGEQYTGALATDRFPAPERVAFLLAGHNGSPDQVDHHRNRIELVDAASGEVLRTALPPRSDVLQRVEWDCRDLQSREVILRCIDGDAAGAYAWLAFGQVEPNWLEPSETVGPLRRALQLVTDYQLRQFLPQLNTLLNGQQLSLRERAKVGRAMAALNRQPLLTILFDSVDDAVSLERLPANWLQAATTELALDVSQELVAWSKQLNASGQRQFTLRLVANRELVAPLLETIDAGAMSAQVLLDKNVADKIEAVITPTQQKLYEQLRQLAEPTDDAVQAAMQEVLAAYSRGAGQVAIGAALFTKHCANCHQLAGVGQVVGPQLDGVGGRGPVRLIEDILQPDRNVDRAFRVTTVLTLDGQVLTGLVRSEDEFHLMMVGNDGKPFQIVKDEIEELRQGTKSLMPGNFHETLKTDELASLIRYLEQEASQASKH